MRKRCTFCQGQSGQDVNSSEPNTTLLPTGCEHCGHTGYSGRTGVFELLVTNDAVRAQIHNRASEAEIRAAALKSGMTLMREDGQRLVAAGITSPEELLRVTPD